MHRSWIVILAVLLAVGWAGAGDHEKHAAPAIDDARFEFLKKLEGQWVGESLSGDHPEGRFEFRVTAGGTAVEEREMIGTPMEMLTVYHMQGRDLVGRHYCVLGNQPSMVAAPKVVDDTLSFACDGKPGNTASHDEEHVHGWSMRLDGDKLHYSAELVKDGQVTKAPTVVLTRVSRTASR